MSLITQNLPVDQVCELRDTRGNRAHRSIESGPMQDRLAIGSRESSPQVL